MKRLTMETTKKIGAMLHDLDTSEMPPSKTSNLQGESEQPPPILYFEIGPVNGQMRPVIIQWEAGPYQSHLVATIFNNADIMDPTTAP